MIEIPEGEFLLPLFPLPTVVFFPHTRLPLHIFEPRYREMVADVLKGNCLIGMVLLKPGWEKEYFEAPPVFAFGTVGEIERFVQFEDGRYNIVLNGIVRYRILETVAESPYRIARVVADPELPVRDEDSIDQRGRLVGLAERYLKHTPGDTDIPELETAAFDSIVNALVMALNIDPTDRQRLLEMEAISERTKKVVDHLERTLEVVEFLAPYRVGGDPGYN